MPSSRPTRSKQRSKELPDNSKSKFTLQSFVRAFPSAPELTYFQPGLLGLRLYLSPEYSRLHWPSLDILERLRVGKIRNTQKLKYLAPNARAEIHTRVASRYGGGIAQRRRTYVYAPSASLPLSIFGCSCS